MPNNYFKFKQFTINQDKCAMKVCTDACLFGAFVANTFEDKPLFDILDIGAGTGLLSLMLAQKNNAAIDAVEIEAGAYEQAKQNILQSPWKEKINILNAGIADFYPNHKYDLIISNPPFFEDDLPSTDKKKNAAKHNTTLTLQELLHNIDRLLNEAGSFAVLLPHHRVDYFIKKSEAKGFYLSNKLLVKQTSTHHFFRGILIFSRKESNIITAEITIKNAAANYTGEFINLLKDYYLYL
jgi:tRNA1Val (adenine37-N6)-methyltransferase